jgi:hypothetical protein
VSTWNERKTIGERRSSIQLKTLTDEVKWFFWHCVTYRGVIEYRSHNFWNVLALIGSLVSCFLIPRIIERMLVSVWDPLPNSSSLIGTIHHLWEHVWASPIFFLGHILPSPQKYYHQGSNKVSSSQISHKEQHLNWIILTFWLSCTKTPYIRCFRRTLIK